MLGMVAILFALAGGILACGGGGKTIACPAIATAPSTTPGTYTVTVTGTSGAITATGPVTLTVQ
jgi:hypothetical protein